MEGTVPFLRYSRKKLRSVAGKPSVKTNDVENDSKLSEGKMGKAKIEGRGGDATTDITEKRNEGVETPLKRKRGADVEIALACLSSPERKPSRLRPRKEVPSFREIDLCNSDSLRIVGKRVKVYWPDSRRWFIGRVKAFHRRKRLHAILYEDGDKEELDLKKERFELEVFPTENFRLRTEPNYGKRLIKVHSVEADNELNEHAIRVVVSGLRGRTCAESTKITEVGNETAETFGKQVTELVSVKDTVSGDDTDGENVLKDFSKEAENGEPPKRCVRPKKKMASRNSKIGSSKSRCKEGSKEMKMKASDQDVEGCQKVDDQEKRGKKIESPVGKSTENNSISYEIQLTNSDSDATKEEDSFYDVKGNGKSGEKLLKEKEPASKKVGIVRKAGIGDNTESEKSPIKRRRSAVITNWIHDLQGIEGEMKNGNSRENLSKEKELASKEAGEVGKAENICNAESQRSPIKRRRTAVVLI